MKLLLSLVDAYKVNPTNPISMKSLIKVVKKGRRIVIFPEGRITLTGSLMKIFEGPAMVADKSGAMLLPIRIEGAQYTPFSKLRGKLHIRWFPKIHLHILGPRKLEIDPEIRGKARRLKSGEMLYDLMTDMVFNSSNLNECLFEALLSAKRVHGGKHIALEDVERKPINYKQLIQRCLIVGDHFKKTTEPEELVGLLFPNMVTTVICFFGLHAVGRVPAMLNYSAGPANLANACKTGKIKRVYTSHRFVEMAKCKKASM